MSATLRIDFVSDISCPWCAIGLTALEQALARMGDAVQAVYDYVNFVWDSLLYSLLVLSGYKMLLETQLLHLGLQLQAFPHAHLDAAVMIANRQVHPASLGIEQHLARVLFR